MFGKTSADKIVVAQCPSTKEKIVPRNPYWLCYCPERPSGFIRVIWALKNIKIAIIKYNPRIVVNKIVKKS